MATEIKPCPNCSGANLYQTDRISAGGGYAPNYLPGLSQFLGRAKFDIIVCGDCGFTRFFAREEARLKLRTSKQWHQL